MAENTKKERKRSRERQNVRKNLADRVMREWERR